MLRYLREEVVTGTVATPSNPQQVVTARVLRPESIASSYNPSTRELTAGLVHFSNYEVGMEFRPPKT